MCSLELFNVCDPLLHSVPSFFRRIDSWTVYLLLLASLAALVLPPYFGYRYRGNFWADMLSTNDALTSMTLDVLIVAFAFISWFIRDMQQLKFSLVSMLVLLACHAVAISLPVPLYLAARSVRLAKQNSGMVIEETQELQEQQQHHQGDEGMEALTLFCPLFFLGITALGSQLVFIFAL